MENLVEEVVVVGVVVVVAEDIIFALFDLEEIVEGDVSFVEASLVSEEGLKLPDFFHDLESNLEKETVLLFSIIGFGFDKVSFVTLPEFIVDENIYAKTRVKERWRITEYQRVVI